MLKDKKPKDTKPKDKKPAEPLSPHEQRDPWRDNHPYPVQS
jgi:hypothetical protein